MEIIFATQNPHKVEEISAQLLGQYELKSLLDLNYTEELEETQDTLEGNALQKVRFVYKKFGMNCFADDTGLEVDSLNGEPGVYSARYAGEDKSFHHNMDKVLHKMKDKKNRNARFRTVIACIIEGKEYLFEGVCEGKITADKRGEHGFGYDPIFQPTGYEQTFAQMPLGLKSEVGHRGKAVKQFADFLNQRSFG